MSVYIYMYNYVWILCILMKMSPYTSTGSFISNTAPLFFSQHLSITPKNLGISWKQRFNKRNTMMMMMMMMMMLMMMMMMRMMLFVPMPPGPRKPQQEAQ